MASGVVVALAPKCHMGQVSHADKYLRGELEKQKEEGIVKTDSHLYDGLNVDRDNFTKNLQCYLKQYDKHPKRLCYEYVQSFSPEDKTNGLTPEKAHKMGLELARKQFPDYPVLVTTHIDTEHIHNQFLVGNVNVDTGKCFKCSTNDLNRWREQTAEMCQERGYTHSIHEMPSDKPINAKVKKSEKLMTKQLHQKGLMTDKEQIAYVIRNEIPNAENLDDLQKTLKEKYQIETRTTKNTISFSHPDMKRPVRGDKLGEDLTKGAIENGIRYYQSERSYGEAELYDTLKSIADNESRKESARTSINERYGQREDNGGNTFPRQSAEKGRTISERTGASTLTPSETVRSITERVQRTTIEGRQYFKDHLRELIEKRKRSKSKYTECEQKVTGIESRRTETEQRIDSLSAERSQIPNRIRELNEKITKHQSRGISR